MPISRVDRAMSRVVPVLAGCIAMSVCAPSAEGQTPANIIRDIRPLVVIELTSPIVAGNPTALGIFDTGSTAVFIPPETNTILGIATVAPAAPGPTAVFTNLGIVGAPIDLQIGGWLGAALGGPEILVGGPPPTSPAHLFTTAARLGVREPATRTGISASLTYFNGTFSEPNIGASFVNGDGARQAPLVAIVDPTNASYLPFATANAPVPAVINPGPPPEPLATPGLPLEQTTSSVSFLGAGSGQVPTALLNANPSFLLAVPLIATDASRAEQPAGTAFNRSAGTNGATIGIRPSLTVTAALQTALDRPLTGSNAGNLVQLGNYLADTGNPETVQAGQPRPNLGSDYLNGFGQYWNFDRRELLLFGPRTAEDRALAGPGIIFNVDRDAVGLARTGVNQLNRAGLPPVLNAANPPGDPTGRPTISPLLAGSQATAFYRTHLTHANAAYIDGIGALGLFANPGGDLIDGLSMGKDLVNEQGRLFFSVDGRSVGISGAGFGNGVPGQSARLQHMGDIFESRTGRPLIVRGVNTLRFNQDLLGLGANIGPLVVDDAMRGNADNLRDFDLRTQDAFVGADIARVMRNIDPFIRFPGDNRNPGAGVAGNHGVRGDVWGVNFDTYFSLDNASPHVGGSAADILVNNQAGIGFHRFASAADIGLLDGDDIDAIAFSRPGIPLQSALIPGGIRSPFLIASRYDPNPLDGFAGIDAFNGRGLSDLMLFSLARDSPSLAILDPFLGRWLSAADVFVTDFDGSFALWATAESLGLNPFLDNIDGLDVIAGPRDPPLPPVPAPPTLPLLLAATGMLLLTRVRTTSSTALWPPRGVSPSRRGSRLRRSSGPWP